MKPVRKNEPLSGLTSFIGFLLSIAGLILLVIFSALHGRTVHIVGLSIFGSGLILLYLTSTIYHLIPKMHRAKTIFRKIDHSMIYILIASTYTPIMLVFPQRERGWSILSIVWGLALVGIIVKMLGKNGKKWFIPFPYIVMGWLGMVALQTLFKSFPQGGIRWLLLGGVLYTSGVVFYVLDSVFPKERLFGMHEMWHLFVIGGSFSHFWLMFKYEVYI